MIKVEDIKKLEIVKTFIKRADLCLEAIGYTEHGFRHTGIVSVNSKRILQELGYSEKMCELAAIAGYLHDIGNAINRVNHPHYSALMAKDILLDLGMNIEDTAIVMSAIGNHDESFGGEPVNPISAALIIADKADVHRSRVRGTDQLSFDIHDRVNYAAIHSSVVVNKEEKIISLELSIDTQISQVMEYFEIFLSRMVISKKSANFLGCKFKLVINEYSLL
ncbi:HD domain-containing protein [Haliovirga abyssi]|uniref:Phosphohydrolase n=1 Tax=Haliovirga abyssi TaxID=2996794 RepID=A0AAU9E262_9FUSO|nr:HD domain-containing protein [Haliovirga abyssi]BDU50490.1 phosphohydrolase [Haliovirga abyssi]